MIFAAFQSDFLYNYGNNLNPQEVSMKPIEVVKSSARIVTNAGLAIVGKLLNKAGFYDKCNSLPVSQAHPETQISYSDIFATAIGSLCSGNPSFEATREFDDDKAFYQDALGIERIPSAERLRQRLDQAASEELTRGFELHNGIRDINLAILKQEDVRISPLPNGDIPVDGDVTPYDESKSHKEGVFRTYKGFDGYAPMDAHIGTEGHFINTDFRIGKQHSQNGTPVFLIETIDLCNRLTGNKTLLFRLDSGNDSVENIGIIMERGHHFIIKRNPRSESKEEWLALAKKYAPIQEHPREGKTVYTGSTWKTVSYTGMDGQVKTQTLRIVFEVIERTIDRDGQVLLIPEIELGSWWDNTGLPDKEVIEYYHQHGTMEQYHSELKTDMDMERLPSGKFATNRLVHELSMIAYNILRILGDLLCDAPDVPMRGKASRRRLRTVITHIIQTPARIISHARKIQMDVGSSNVWADTFIWLYNKICTA